MKQANEKYRNQVYLSGAKLMHYLASIALFFVFWMLFRYGALRSVGDVGFRYNYYAAAGYAACLMFFCRTYNAYLLGYTRVRMLVFSQMLAQFFSAVVLYITVSFAWNQWKSPLWFLPMLALDAALDVFWSCWGNKLYFQWNPTKNTILIYRDQQDKRRLGTLGGKPTERLYKITRELQYDGSFHDLEKELMGFDAVFVAGVNSRCRNGILKYCKAHDIPGFFLPHVGDVIMQEAVHVQAFDAPVLHVKRSAPSPEYRIMKRLFDVALSLLCIVAFSPVMLAIAAAVRCCDRGPVLYKQVRLTRNGKRFKILKFRSMRVDAEKDGPCLSSGKGDSRVTPVGRVIRMCRLDELPQLFNILAGDMSFVGPRPERPEIAAQYEKTIPDFPLRLQVKAGLTGYAQVYGKYSIDPYEKLQFDLLYINHMNMLTDINLLFATAAILFLKEKTEGADAEQTTAENRCGTEQDAAP